MSRTKNKPDFVKYLSQALYDNPVWKSLYEKTQTIMASHVEERMNQLENLRVPFHIKRGDFVDYNSGRYKVIQTEYDNISKVENIYIDYQGTVVKIPMKFTHERDILVNGSSVNGFNYFSDSFSNEDYSRIYQYIQEYWPFSGDGNFIKFLGFIKGLNLDIHTLWDSTTNYETKETYNLLERLSSDMTPVYSNSNASIKYYPSSHVEVEYDYFRNLDFDVIDFINLFYYMAPAYLVLHRLTRAAFVKMNWKSNSTSQLNMLESSSFLASLDLNSATKIMNANQIVYYESSVFTYNS